MLILSLLSLAASAWAIDPPVRDIRQYNEAKDESVIKVSGARVVLADYGLIRRDFPQTAQMSNGEIDRWILEQAGYIARTQVMNVQADQLNTPIEVDYRSIIRAYRPADYGRGLVFKAGVGLLDGKGFGSLNPRVGTNTHGLMELSQGFREYIMQKLVHGLALKSNGLFTTVETYAVIDWGFDMKQLDGTLTPAGAILRQAHTRETWNFNSNLGTDYALPIELYLRKHGITSTGLSSTLRNQPFSGYDIINIQGKTHSSSTGFSSVVDFGTFLRVPEGHVFTTPLAMRATKAAFPSTARFGTFDPWTRMQVLNSLLSPDQEGFVHRAVNEKAIPAQGWASEGDRLYPESDQLSQAAERLAQEYRAQLAAGRPFEDARNSVRLFNHALMNGLRLPGIVCDAEGLLTKRLID